MSSLARLIREVDQFNAAVPPGTPVLYWPGAREGEGRESVTRSAAWLMGEHTPVVKVEGYAGGIALTHVMPVPRTTSDQKPSTTESDGIASRVIDGATGKDITDEWNLACENGTTLRDACALHDLPVSGTKRAQARRLLAAGVTHEHVQEHHGWRARLARRQQSSPPGTGE